MGSLLRCAVLALACYAIVSFESSAAETAAEAIPATPKKSKKRTKPAVKKAPESKQTPEEIDFERAVGLTTQGIEDEALVSMTDFLRRYPNSSLSDDAQYWLGEIEFRRRNFDTARSEFLKVLKYKDKGGDKVPDAMLRLGDVLVAMDRKLEAKIEWQALMRIYPEHAVAKSAREKIQGIK